jgi:hypothetical protein
MGKCKPFVYGGHFFWLCNCSGVKDLLNCDAPVQQLKLWEQELMGYVYKLMVLHRSNKFMKDSVAMNYDWEMHNMYL